MYIAIDLKSFYASVECMALGYDPLTTHLVVADESRSAKTICLAASPSLKAYGVPGRARLFEVVQKVKEINLRRKAQAPNHILKGKSSDAIKLAEDLSLALDFVIAKPRMALYLEKSAQIYGIYLRYISPEDIHSYSIDEVFIDVAPYLKTYNMTARELAVKMIKDVERETGITATAGIGTNLYLAKIAMDIMAKKMPVNEDGVRVAELDEMTYRQQLWTHMPITDFWRVGKGYARKLKEHGLHTMGDIARCSVGKANEYYNEELLYKIFGVNAQLLIDHAWGYEPCTMQDIKAYKPVANSLSSGQVLQSGYSYEKGRLIVWEMTDVLVLDLVEKGLVTDQIGLYVGYDVESIKNYQGAVHRDHYGRTVPKPANSSVKLGRHTSSGRQILAAVMELYDKIINPGLLIRRVNVTANNVLPEAIVRQEKNQPEQLELFTDYEELDQERAQSEYAEEKEKSLQHTLIDLKNKYGKNAILKGANFQEGAMTRERNQQIGGHKA